MDSTTRSNRPNARTLLLSLLAVASICAGPALAESKINSRVDGRSSLASNASDPNAYIEYARYLESVDDLKAAEQVLETGRNKAEKSAELLVFLGEIYVEQDRLAKAESIVQEALVVDPTYVEAHLRMGEIRFRLGWPKSGMESFEKAHELDPERVTPMVRIVGGLIEQSKLAEAEDQCLRFLSVHAHEADLWLALGKVFEKQDKLREAFTTYGQVLTLDDQSAEAYARQGRLFCRFSQFTAAEHSCLKALSIDQNNVLAHAYLGIAYSHLGRGDEAKKHAEIAEAGGMNMTAVWKRLGN